MKKTTVSILAFALFAAISSNKMAAQAYLGIGAGFSTTPKQLFDTKEVGGTETSGPAGQVRLQFPLKDKLSLSLDGNYYLDKVDYAHYWAVDLNAIYRLFRVDKLSINGLVGANAYWVTVPHIVNTPLLGLNLGGSAFYDLSSISVFAEFRYTPGQAKHQMLALGAAIRMGKSADDGWDDWE